MSASRILSLLALTTALFSGASALTCYENDESGAVFERTNADWKYCSLIPAADGKVGGRLSGVGELTENLVGYDATFGQNTKLYQVLVMCIYERYNFGAINPVFGPLPEYMFRCMCNTDLCNKETTFSRFLNHVRH